MNIVIASRKEAEQLLKTTEFSGLVSIHEPVVTSPYGSSNESRPCYGYGKFVGPKISFDFEDEEREDNRYWYPKERDVQQLLTWYEVNKPRLEAGNILCHCQAGISRSSAVAFTLYVASGLDPVTALQKVIHDRPQAWPNSLVVKHADKLLSCSNKMIQTLEKIEEITDSPYWIDF